MHQCRNARYEFTMSPCNFISLMKSYKVGQMYATTIPEALQPSRHVLSYSRKTKAPAIKKECDFINQVIIDVRSTEISFTCDICAKYTTLLYCLHLSRADTCSPDTNIIIKRERKCLCGASLWNLSLNCCYLSLWNIDSAGGKDWQLHESLLVGLLAEAKGFDIQTLTIGGALGRWLPSHTRDNYPSENRCARGISHTHKHTYDPVPETNSHCDIYTGEQDWSLENQTTTDIIALIVNNMKEQFYWIN